MDKSITNAPDTAVGDGELRIDIRPHRMHCVDFFGSRSRLEAEGLVPPGTKWPERGASVEGWEDGRFIFELGRTRPEGMKGPMRLWHCGDWWRLRRQLTGAPHWQETRIIDQRQALAEAIYRQSPAWHIEHEKHWKRYLRATRDEAFQQFLRRVPALEPKPRRRSAGSGATDEGRA